MKWNGGIRANPRDRPDHAFDCLQSPHIELLLRRCRFAENSFKRRFLGEKLCADLPLSRKEGCTVEQILVVMPQLLFLTASE